MATIPNRDELQSGEKGLGHRGRSKRQAQLTVLASKAGVAESPDLRTDGYDTHHPDHYWPLGNLADAVNFPWDPAELHGVAETLAVVMGSDFGEPNKYNSERGKDHLPIDSFTIMQDDQGWTNRVIGETDGRHFPYDRNPKARIHLRRVSISCTSARHCESSRASPAQRAA